MSTFAQGFLEVVSSSWEIHIRLGFCEKSDARELHKKRNRRSRRAAQYDPAFPIAHLQDDWIVELNRMLLAVDADDEVYGRRSFALA